jgi:hypothetical protein
LQPECTSYIDAYLEYRKNNGEVLNEDSYLIRDQFDITDLEQIRNKSKGIARHTVLSIVENALLKAGVKTIDHTSKYNRKKVMKCHGFRKFAFTAMSNAKINPEIREMLVGHKMNLASCYYRPTEEEMLAEYMKAVNLLTINEENRLRLKVEKLEVEKTEVQSLAAEIAMIKKKFKIK